MTDFDLNSPIEPNLKKMIIPVLRKYWRYSKIRGDAIKLARVSRGFYKCNICKLETFKREDMQVDHIEPAQTLANKMTTWYDLIYFISRLFVPTVDKVQVVCKVCHSIKTAVERKIRVKNRKKKKVLDKLNESK